MFLAQEHKEVTAKFIATAKLAETICFADFAIFHVCLIQIYFESKYLKKLRFLDSNTEGFESIGFDILLYASLDAMFYEWNVKNVVQASYDIDELKF